MSPPRTDAAAGQPEWLKRKERGSVAVIRFTVWLALAAGRPITRLLLPLPSLYFLIFSRASRSASRLYLSRVLGRKSTLLEVFRHYLTFAACVLDRVFFLADRTQHFELRFHGEEIVEGFLAEGLLILSDGVERNVVAFTPPFVIATDDLLWAAGRLAEFGAV